MADLRYIGIQPHFTVKDGRAALEFYRTAFGAEVQYSLTDPSDGRLGHADIRIGQSVLMLNDEYPDFGALAPDTIGGSPVSFYVEVTDADAAIARALASGATLLRPAADQSYGHRNGMVLDPFGYRWSIGHKLEEVSAEDMQRRWDAETAA
ncbi:VOC family protein [Tabrizicola sp.]|uniref:VOC family protein n=1 Tax=Tabrizicola sp. TaxID=2005166 RepID=UPI003F33A79F